MKKTTFEAGLIWSLIIKLIEAYDEWQNQDPDEHTGMVPKFTT